MRLVASPDGADGSVTIHQDAKLYAAVLASGQEVRHELADDRYSWLQVARGEVILNNQSLNQGDGAAINRESLAISAPMDSEILLFDLA